MLVHDDKHLTVWSGLGWSGLGWSGLGIIRLRAIVFLHTWYPLFIYCLVCIVQVQLELMRRTWMDGFCACCVVWLGGVFLFFVLILHFFFSFLFFSFLFFSFLFFSSTVAAGQAKPASHTHRTHTARFPKGGFGHTYIYII
ncbi:hypothetical protein B0T19DRAFT_118135 [Cercophora scortea]|uniref:Uncharacterized protein n=1 Tax=Cercophora scortea TaxID=314031 RepID=A0AAE0MIQ8_9PEZI|nr:hypothetical protein B0T19DRAFT_118135 [Cercophora scortea]